MIRKISNPDMANLRLKEYLEIKEEIAKMEKQLEEIKKEILQAGDFVTNKYIVVIMEVKQNRVVGGEELIGKLGAELVKEKELIKETFYKKINVKETNRKAS